jgi:hypothetical protein
VTDKKLHGGFRHGDLRYSKELYKINKVLLINQQPIRYMVEGIKNASYTRDELLLADEKESAEHQAADKKRLDDEEKKKADENRAFAQQLEHERKYPHMVLRSGRNAYKN